MSRKRSVQPKRPVVTFENLQDWAMQLPREGPFVEPFGRLIPLAQLVITKIMGKGWAAEHLSFGGEFNKWLIFRIEDTAGFALRNYRFVHLAEVLYELQFQPEFELRLKQMQKGKLADFFFELEVAWWLQRNGAQVVLRGEHAMPKYDADLILNGTFRVAAEIKRKAEVGPFNGERIRRDLIKARDEQLPWDDRFSMVIVQLPTEWAAADVPIPEAIRESVYSVFGCEKRPWAVLFYWVTWEPGGDWVGRAMYNHSLMAHNLDETASTAIGKFTDELGKLEKKAHWMIDLLERPPASAEEIEVARVRSPLAEIATKLICFSATPVAEGG
jgi:hypothetical protein